MSSAGLSLTLSSTSSPTIPSPSRLMRAPRLVAIAPELAADDVGFPQRRHGPHHGRLAVANGLGVAPGRRLHGKQGHDLEHVVLHHITDRAGRLVERPAALDTERLRLRDLDAGDVVAVPDRLEERG